MPFHYASCTCSPGQAEESLADCFADMFQSAPLSWRSTLEKSYCNDSETDISRGSQFGTMFARLTENRGAEKSMSYAEDFHAKTSQVQGKEQGYPVADPVYGGKCPELLGRYDPHTHSLKTPQDLLAEDSTLCLQTLPVWGMMQSGECWEVMMLGLVTTGNGCGYWPTPMKGDAHTIKIFPAKTAYKNIKSAHCSHIADYFLINSVNLSTAILIIEEMMAWPLGWTGLPQLATDKTREWCDSLG